ncbi:MAG: limonene-1,2-epoxide hydrolase family protein [Vicinamibacterales bacterium]
MQTTNRPSRVSRRQVLTTAGLSAAALALAGTAAAQAKAPTEQERANIKVIDDFLVAWNKRDMAGVASFLAPAAKFAAAKPGKFTQLTDPKISFGGFIPRTKSISMVVKPGTTRAVGPMVTHERVDTMVMQDGGNLGSGTWFGVFSVVDGKIHDFIDFQIA